MLDEGLGILEEGFVKARNILIGYPPKALFTADHFIHFYHCVYTMCIQKAPHDYASQLYERYKSALEESIVLVVLPSLNEKHGPFLLIELLQMWENYKVMTKFLSGVFIHLDRYFVVRNGRPSLRGVAILCFHDLVCCKLDGHFRDVAISLINQDRNGKQVQQDLLKSVFTFVMEIGEGNKSYYETFEQLILADAANYYSQLASQQLFCNSYTDYIQKVEWLLIQEKEKAGYYMQQGSLEKLLQVVKGKLLDETAHILIEKQKAENYDASTYQDLLSKYAGMGLG